VRALQGGGARFGGEEFAAALPATDAEEARYVADRVRAAVAGRPFVLDGGASLRCTIGIGVAPFPDDARDMAGLIKQADAAVYRAKRTRNAVAHRSLSPAAKGPPVSADGRPLWPAITWLPAADSRRPGLLVYRSTK